jgi:hypothetical protein
LTSGTNWNIRFRVVLTSARRWRFSMTGIRLISCTALACAAAVAQPPDTLWTAWFGGDHTDLALSVVPTADGGFVFAGSADAGGNLDAWLVRTDGYGSLVWSETFGGTGEDAFSSVRETSDGGFVMCGYTTSSGAGSYDAWLVRADAGGGYLWDATFGGTGQDLGFEALQLTDGGYAAVGYASDPGTGDYDVLLVRTDSLGSAAWEKSYGLEGDDEGYSVDRTSDGGFVLTGYTSSTGPGPYNLWLIRTDGSGTMLWNRVLGGTQGEIGRCVRQTSDGGYIVTGCTTSSGAGLGDMWLVRLDEAGSVVWDRSFGGPQWDSGFSVTETWGGGFAVTGYTDTDGPSEGSGYDLWIVKTDADGDLDWEAILDCGYDSWGQSLAHTSDGGYIVAGYSWIESSGPDDFDAWLIRLDQDTGISPEGDPQAVSPDITSVFPNPSGGTFCIRCSFTGIEPPQALVYSLSGRLVRRLVPGGIEDGSCVYTWDTLDLSGAAVPAGVYLLRVASGSGSSSARLVLVR